MNESLNSNNNNSPVTPVGDVNSACTGYQPEPLHHTVTSPVATEYKDSNNQEGFRSSGNFSVKVTSKDSEKTKKDLLDTLRTKYEQLSDTGGKGSSPGVNSHFELERYRDNLEGSDFVDKVSKFEFLAHANNPRSPVKSPISGSPRRLSPQRFFETSPRSSFEYQSPRQRFSPQRVLKSPSPSRVNENSPVQNCGHVTDSSPTGPGSVHIGGSSKSVRVRPVALPKTFAKYSHTSAEHISAEESQQTEASPDVFKFDGIISSGPLYAKVQNRSCEFATHVRSPVISPLYVKQANQSFHCQPESYNCGSSARLYGSNNNRQRYSQELHILPQPSLSPEQSLSPVYVVSSQRETVQTKPKLHVLNTKKPSDISNTQSLPREKVESEHKLFRSRSPSPNQQFRAQVSEADRNYGTRNLRVRSGSPAPKLPEKQKNSSQYLSQLDSYKVRSRSPSPKTFNRSISEPVRNNTSESWSLKLRSRSPSPKRLAQCSKQASAAKPPPSPAEAKECISKKLYSKDNSDKPPELPPKKNKKIKPSVSVDKESSFPDNPKRFVYKSASLDRVTSAFLQKHKNDFDYKSGSLKSPPKLLTQKSCPAGSSEKFDVEGIDQIKFDIITSSLQKSPISDAKSAKLVSRSQKAASPVAPTSTKKEDTLSRDSDPVWVVRPEPADVKHHTLYPEYKEYLKEKEKSDTLTRKKKRSSSENRTTEDQTVVAKAEEKRSGTNPEEVQSDTTSSSSKSPDTKKEKNNFWYRLTKSASKDSVSGKDKKSNKSSKSKKAESTVQEEDPDNPLLIECTGDSIDDDDFAFSSKINSPKHTKVYFTGLEKVEDTKDSVEAVDPGVTIEISEPRKGQVEVVLVHAAANSEDSLLDTDEGKLSKNSSFTESKASLDSLDGSKGDVSSQTEKDKIGELDSYSGVKCFSKDTAVTNIVLPGYKKTAGSVDGNDNVLNDNPQSKETDILNCSKDSDIVSDLDFEVPVQSEAAVLKEQEETLHITEIKPEHNFTTAYINKPPTYHDYDEVPIYDEVPLDSPVLKKASTELKSEEIVTGDDLGKKTPDVTETKNNSEDYKDSVSQNNTSSADSVDQKGNTKVDHCDDDCVSESPSPTNKPVKKIVTFAVDTKESIQKEKGTCPESANLDDSGNDYEDVSVIKAACEDSKETESDMDRFNQPRTPNSAKFTTKDTSFGLNMLRQASLPNGGTGSEYFNRAADPMKQNVNGRHSLEDIISNSNTDSTSLDDLDFDELTGSQQDLKELHRRMQEERKQEQEMAEQEKQRLEDILNMCAEYEKQLEEEKRVGTKPSPSTPSHSNKNMNSLKIEDISNRSSGTSATTDQASTLYINGPQSPSATNSVQSPILGDRRDSSRSSMTKIKTNGSLTKVASPSLVQKDIGVFDYSKSSLRRRNSSSDDSEHDSMSESGTIKRRPHHALTVNTDIAQQQSRNLSPSSSRHSGSLSPPLRHSGSLSPPPRNSGNLSPGSSSTSGSQHETQGYVSPKVNANTHHFHQTGLPRSPMSPMAKSSAGAISKTSLTSAQCNNTHHTAANATIGGPPVSTSPSHSNNNNNSKETSALAELRLEDSTGNYDNLDNYVGLFQNLDTTVNQKASPSPKSDISATTSVASDVEGKNGAKDGMNWSSGGDTSSEQSLNQAEVRGEHIFLYTTFII